MYISPVLTIAQAGKVLADYPELAAQASSPYCTRDELIAVEAIFESLWRTPNFPRSAIDRLKMEMSSLFHTAPSPMHGMAESHSTAIAARVLQLKLLAMYRAKLAPFSKMGLLDLIDLSALEGQRWVAPEHLSEKVRQHRLDAAKNSLTEQFKALVAEAITA